MEAPGRPSVASRQALCRRCRWCRQWRPVHAPADEVLAGRDVLHAQERARQVPRLPELARQTPRQGRRARRCGDCPADVGDGSAWHPGRRAAGRGRGPGAPTAGRPPLARLPRLATSARAVARATQRHRSEPRPPVSAAPRNRSERAVARATNPRWMQEGNLRTRRHDRGRQKDRVEPRGGFGADRASGALRAAPQELARSGPRLPEWARSVDPVRSRLGRQVGATRRRMTGDALPRARPEDPGPGPGQGRSTSMDTREDRTAMSPRMRQRPQPARRRSCGCSNGAATPGTRDAAVPSFRAESSRAAAQRSCGGQAGRVDARRPGYRYSRQPVRVEVRTGAGTRRQRAPPRSAQRNGTACGTPLRRGYPPGGVPRAGMVTSHVGRTGEGSKALWTRP